MTVAALSIGMALAPAAMNIGVAYADAKDIGSPTPMVQSEETGAEVSASQTEEVVIGDKEYKITAEMTPAGVAMKKGDTKELRVELKSNVMDATASNAISAAAADGFTWDSSADHLTVSGSKTNTADVTCTETSGPAIVTASVTIEGVAF